MPQPLSNVVRIRSNLAINLIPDTAGVQPELAALAMRAIALCAHSDYNLGRTFVTMLGPQAAPAFAMYDAFRWSHPKTKALKAASRMVLGDEDYRIFEALLKVFGQDAAQRNIFAHWIWAYCDEARDYLVLVDPMEPLRWETSAAHIPLGTTGALDDVLSVAKWIERASCYSKSELEKIVERFVDTFNSIGAFKRLIGHQALSEISKEQQRLILASQPRLAQALLHLDLQ
jgi:hypothetical protein